MAASCRPYQRKAEQVGWVGDAVHLWVDWTKFCGLLRISELYSNQIYLMMFMCLTVDTSLIFTKKSNFAKWFFDICNLEMAQWRQIVMKFGHSSQFSMSKNVRIFLFLKNINLGPHFLTTSILKSFCY